MKAKRTTLELIAQSTEEAVQNGLDELGLKREDVEVEILDEGSRGLFGLGSRQARVRLSVKDQSSRSGLESEVSKMGELPETSLEMVEDQDEDIEELESDDELEAELESAQSLMDDLTFHVIKETIEELLKK